LERNNYKIQEDIAYKKKWADEEIAAMKLKKEKAEAEGKR
jgi:hypothetical protein